MKRERRNSMERQREGKKKCRRKKLSEKEIEGRQIIKYRAPKKKKIKVLLILYFYCSLTVLNIKVEK